MDRRDTDIKRQDKVITEALSLLSDDVVTENDLVALIKDL